MCMGGAAVVMTSKGKKYPVRSKASEERTEWIERIGLALNPANSPLAVTAFSSNGPASTMGKVTALSPLVLPPLS